MGRGKGGFGLTFFLWKLQKDFHILSITTLCNSINIRVFEIRIFCFAKTFLKVFSGFIFLYISDSIECEYVRF